MAQKSEIIIGIDPGTRISGYGIIQVSHQGFTTIDYGCIKPPSTHSLTARYRIIFEAIEGLLKKHAPTALAVETQFINKNVQSGIKLGMARGVAMLAASLRDIPIFEYAPTKAKRAVVGTGRASKQQVQGMVKQLLALPTLPEPEDAADALALAICHAHCTKRRSYQI